jgi:hypothetical protein
MTTVIIESPSITNRCAVIDATRLTGVAVGLFEVQGGDSN